MQPRILSSGDPQAKTADQFDILLNNEFNVDTIIAASPSAPVMRDDRPTNEYFAVRYLKSHLLATTNLANAPSFVPGETATSTRDRLIAS